MKKSKMIYLRVIIILFILIWIPYFQYVAVATPVEIPFFGGTKDFSWLYPIMLFLGVVEGALITLFVQNLLRGIQDNEPQKFDLN